MSTMQYELVYYKKNDTENKKNVIVSATLKEIDRYIIRNNITDMNLLYKSIDCDSQEIDRVLIISKDNKYTRPILYYDTLSVLNKSDFLDTVYNLYACKPNFKSLFEENILDELIRIKSNKKIKDIARNVVIKYPSYSAFYKFYNKYLEPRMEFEKDIFVVYFNYSKLRKFGEVYDEYVKTKDNKMESENKKYVKSKRSY